jgi:diaminohydroxyphosphoribosylaminopyrimidine deaminase/5-amino-6-(5-phosphoribosylamino)uracil reductase
MSAEDLDLSAIIAKVKDGTFKNPQDLEQFINVTPGINNIDINKDGNIDEISVKEETINGKIADRIGNSKWISNEQSRKYVHEVLRSNTDAILTTAHTIIKDNATMNIRIADGEPKELNLIVIDKDLAILQEENKGLNIFYDRKYTKIYLLTDQECPNSLPQHIEIIKASFSAGAINLGELSQVLLSKNICEIVVEAGGKLNASLIKQQLIDEIVLFLCPSLLLDNEAINVFNDSAFQSIENKHQLKLFETKQLDNDLMIKYKVLY